MIHTLHSLVCAEFVESRTYNRMRVLKLHLIPCYSTCRGNNKIYLMRKIIRLTYTINSEMPLTFFNLIHIGELKANLTYCYKFSFNEQKS